MPELTIMNHGELLYSETAKKAATLEESMFTQYLFYLDDLIARQAAQEQCQDSLA